MIRKNDLRIPPQDLEAEQSVLGAIMIDKDAIGNIADILEPNDFYDKKNGVIYETMLSLWDKKAPIDLLSLSSELKKVGFTEQTGDIGYLTDLVNAVPSAAHVAHYASIVKEKKILRDLINASGAITESAMAETEDLDILLDSIEQKVFAITNKMALRAFTLVKNELPAAYERIERISQGNITRGVPIGFTGLDNILSGLQKSDLIIVGARPSFGKTSFALDIMRHVGTKSDFGVGIFSLEMS